MTTICFSGRTHQQAVRACGAEGPALHSQRQQLELRVVGLNNSAVEGIVVLRESQCGAKQRVRPKERRRLGCSGRVARFAALADYEQAKPPTAEGTHEMDHDTAVAAARGARSCGRRLHDDVIGRPRLVLGGEGKMRC